LPNRASASMMSVAEVKASVAGMTAEERLEIAALIAHLNRAESPEYRTELDRRMAAMDLGRKVSSDQVENAHEELCRQGR
jgi:hypothetical protein